MDATPVLCGKRSPDKNVLQRQIEPATTLRMSVIRTDLEDPRLRLLVCGHTRIQPNRWNFSRLSFPYWRLYWNASAGASIRCEKETVPLTPSQAVLIRPDAIFSTRNTKPCGHLYVHFQIPAVVLSSAPSIIRLPMKSPLPELIASICKLLRTSHPPAWKVSFHARALVELALAIADIHPGGAPGTDARVLKVLSYMDDHLKPNTSNADLAREARMSASALNHLFKDQVGHSLQAFLRRKRVEKAALLLQFSDLSIEQIADETGFCDRYHFSKVFRSLQGVGPAAFRQAHAHPFVVEPTPSSSTPAKPDSQ
jgi:AraC-like DNA-binding protein